jgi:hypothetical protein
MHAYSPPKVQVAAHSAISIAAILACDNMMSEHRALDKHFADGALRRASRTLWPPASLLAVAV